MWFPDLAPQWRVETCSGRDLFSCFPSNALCCDVERAATAAGGFRPAPASAQPADGLRTPARGVRVPPSLQGGRDRDVGFGLTHTLSGEHLEPIDPRAKWKGQGNCKGLKEDLFEELKRTCEASGGSASGSPEDCECTYFPAFNMAVVTCDVPCMFDRLPPEVVSD